MKENEIRDLKNGKKACIKTLYDDVDDDNPKSRNETLIIPCIVMVMLNRQLGCQEDENR